MSNAPGVVAFWQKLEVLSSDFVSIPDYCCVLLAKRQSKVQRQKKYGESTLVVLWVGQIDQTREIAFQKIAGLPDSESRVSIQCAIPLVVLEDVHSLRQDFSVQWAPLGTDIITISPQALLVPQWITRLFPKAVLQKMDVWAIRCGQQKTFKIISALSFPTIQVEDCFELSIQALLSQYDPSSDHWADSIHTMSPRSAKYNSFNATVLSLPNLSSLLSSQLSKFPPNGIPNFSILALPLGSSHLPFLVMSQTTPQASWIRFPPDIEPSLLILPNSLPGNITKSFLPPHLQEYLQFKILPAIQSSTLIHSMLLENMTMEDQTLLLKFLSNLPSSNDAINDPPGYSSVQIHRCPLSLHLSDSALYRKVFCSRVAMDDRQTSKNLLDADVSEKDLSSIRLGSIQPQTDIGEFFLSYCKQPVRWNFAVQTEHKGQRQLIILVFDDLQHVTLSEWLEVEQIVLALSNELNALSTTHSPPVSLLLLCFWDSTSIILPPIPAIVRRFFNRRWMDNSNSQFSPLTSGNNVLHALQCGATSLAHSGTT